MEDSSMKYTDFMNFNLFRWGVLWLKRVGISSAIVNDMLMQDLKTKSVCVFSISFKRVIAQV